MKSGQQDTPGTDTPKTSKLAKLFGRKNSAPPHQEQPAAETDRPQTNHDRVEDGLKASSGGLLGKISQVFKGTFDLNDELFEDLEEVLMSSDIGVKASLDLVDRLRLRVESQKVHDAKGVISALRFEIAELLSSSETEWNTSHQPYVLLMVGVNGVGKTTTTAKIAQRLKEQGKVVMLAAADTFRAAAVEQLQEWGDKLDIPVICQGQGADAAAVAHDALISARAKQVDVLIIDTAGRLHTQTDLMEQLQKVNRVLQKIDPDTPHEVMQILDAGTGQNAITQLESFQQAVGVSSISITKLDGSAKGGVAIALAQNFELPIRFIGVGESYDDLRPFSATQYANALVPELHKIASAG